MSAGEQFKDSIRCPECGHGVVVDMYSVDEMLECGRCKKCFAVPNWIEIQHGLVRRWTGTKIAEMQECGIKFCEVISAGMETDCEQIKRFSGKPIPIGEFPGLPLPGCKNECKCTVIASLKQMETVTTRKPAATTKNTTGMTVKCAHCGADNSPTETQCGICQKPIYAPQKPAHESSIGGIIGGLFVAVGLAGMLQFGFFYDVTIEPPKADLSYYHKVGLEVPAIEQPKRIVNWQLMNERTVMMIASVGCLVFGGIIGKK